MPWTNVSAVPFTSRAAAAESANVTVANSASNAATLSHLPPAVVKYGDELSGMGCEELPSN